VSGFQASETQLKPQSQLSRPLWRNHPPNDTQSSNCYYRSDSWIKRSTRAEITHLYVRTPAVMTWFDNLIYHHRIMTDIPLECSVINLYVCM